MNKRILILRTPPDFLNLYTRHHDTHQSVLSSCEHFLSHMPDPRFCRPATLPSSITCCPCHTIHSHTHSFNTHICSSQAHLIFPIPTSTQFHTHSSPNLTSTTYSPAKWHSQSPLSRAPTASAPSKMKTLYSKPSTHIPGQKTQCSSYAALPPSRPSNQPPLPPTSLLTPPVRSVRHPRPPRHTRLPLRHGRPRPHLLLRPAHRR